MKLGTLHYSKRKEEGVVKLGPTVDLTVPDVVMLDILGDWIADLTTAYNNLHAITYPKER
jgi:hypothetical protein